LTIDNGLLEILRNFRFVVPAMNAFIIWDWCGFGSFNHTVESQAHKWDIYGVYQRIFKRMSSQG